MDFSDQAQLAQAAQTVQGSEITIPLKLLHKDPLNVRRKSATRGVEELAALIHSQGLLHNLVVRAELAGKKAKKETGRYGATEQLPLRARPTEPAAQLFTMWFSSVCFCCLRSLLSWFLTIFRVLNHFRTHVGLAG